ncbi:MAG: hypothetical protein IKW28_07860 [Lachnospiraceae bacterium]|nr:hypothetical protein [Lachnospiraceae bacterium]
MKEKLSNNLKLKIIAVLFATALWMISININDPYQSKDYTVMVQLQNLNVMTAAGKFVEVADHSDQITVRVRGNRSVMDSFNVTNIIATADLKELDENNQVPIRLSTVRTSGDKIESMSASEEFITVKVEDILRVQKIIEIETKNRAAEGYVLGEVSTEQNALNVSGPESVVKEVSKAVVSLDLAGAKDDVSMLLPIELYDDEGKRIVDTRLTTSINQVQCIAVILGTKEVPVTLVPKGIEARGYGYIGKMLQEPETVLVAGKNTVFNNLKEIKVEGALDLTGARENVTATIDLKEYLPDTIIFADKNFNGEIKATAIVEKEVAIEYPYPVEDILVENIPAEYEAEIAAENRVFPLSLIGFQSAIEEMDETAIRVKADIALYMEEEGLSELTDGTYEISGIIQLPEGVWINEDTVVPIKITSKK